MVDFGVVLAGRICSGKSTVVDFLTRNFDLGLVSFGSFVRHECKRRGLTESRNILQGLGTEMFASMGPELLVTAAMQHAGLHGTQGALFEGVRHLLVLRNIRARSKKSFCVFLDAGLQVRFTRYVSRSPLHSNISLSQFRAIDDDPIERGIEPLRGEADAVVDATAPIEIVWQAVCEALEALGLPKAR